MAKAILFGPGGQVPMLGAENVSWILRTGVEPVIKSFDFDVIHRDFLLEAAESPHRIDIQIGQTIYRLLTILRVVQDSKFGFNTISAIVADRRWTWSRRHIYRRFNVRKRVGYRHYTEPNQKQLAITEAELRFAKFSIKDNGQLFTMEEILDDILDEVEDDGSLIATTFKDKRILEEQFKLKGGGKDLTLENIFIDDQGPGAVRNILRQIGGAAITINANGDLKVFSQVDGRDQEEVDKLGFVAQNLGNFEFSDHKFVRPKGFRIKFAIEAEVRFDYRERLSLDGLPSSHRFLENVIQNTDNRLTVLAPFGPGARFISQLNWIEIQDILDAWNQFTPQGLVLRDGVTFDLIYHAMVHDDVFGAMFLSGVIQQSVGSANADWMARIGALKTHFRQTFKIPDEWRDRVSSIRANLISTINPVTGTRANSPIYCDWAAKISQKGIIRFQRTRPLGSSAPGRKNNTPIYINTPGYPTGGIVKGVPRIISRDSTAPGILNILDPEIGIIRLNFKMDVFKDYSIILPGFIKNNASYNVVGAGVITQDTVLDNVARGKARMQLEPDWNLATIVTMKPIAPRNSNIFFEILILPKDILPFIPDNIKSTIINAQGPVQEIRIPDQIETARVRWSDDPKDTRVTEKIFGFHGGIGLLDLKRLENLVINHTGIRDTEPVIQPGGGTASLKEIARAAAIKFLLSQRDRFVGRAASKSYFDPEVKGNINEIEHFITVKGADIMAIDFLEKPATIDIFSLMDDRTRRVVLKQLYQE